MKKESSPPLPENLAELVVADMQRRALEAGTNLTDLLRNAHALAEDSPFTPQDYDPDCK